MTTETVTATGRCSTCNGAGCEYCAQAPGLCPGCLGSGVLEDEPCYRCSSQPLTITRPAPARPGGETPDDAFDADLAGFIAPIDWEAFWSHEAPEEDWLVQPLVPAGRQVALYSEAKAGKSLLSLEIAAAVATGRAVLDRPAGEPLPVVYIDQEMTDDDLRERLVDLDYGPDTDLSDLHYYQLTALPPLNTPLGGAIVAAVVDKWQAQLVIVDTMARVVHGGENDSDNYRDFYQHTGLLLKRRGVALLRLDHQGKDKLKGQRGSSAKVDDVDIVIALTVTDKNTVKLKRTHTRVPWVPAETTLTRRGEPLRHTTGGPTYPEGTLDAVAALDRHDVPLDATINTALATLKAHNEGKRRTLVGAALKFRRTRP